MVIFLIACISLSTVTENYYGDNSHKVVAISPDSLCANGIEKDLAINRIARANYKHGRYKKAHSLIDTLKTKHNKLSIDTSQLEALLLKNIGSFSKADSIYQQLLSQDIEYDDLNYRIHLNYAELLRLQMDYEKREMHLLKALSYAEGEEYNKTIRVLARHYFNILLDFESAEKILQSHDEFEYLSKESKAGYRLVQAQLAEAKQSYKKAKEYYEKANRIAKQAGFITFQYDAVDGAMRTKSLQEREQSQNWQWYLFNGLFIALIVIIGGWNWYLKRQRPANSV